MKAIIVGGVAGGAGAAARLRRNDESAQIIMIEKGEHISYANCGLPYYIGGTISDDKKLLLQSPEDFKSKFNVDVRVRHKCVSVEPLTKTVQIKNLDTNEVYSESYDKLILSPGAAPVTPRLEGFENAFTLRDVSDAKTIYEFIKERTPKTCVVIGAGFIGLEMAENLVDRGIAVSVVEAGSHVISHLDKDMSHDVHNYIRSKGIKLFLDTKATKWDGKLVHFEESGKTSADLLIVSVGVKPETAFLEESGIVLGKNGEIIVNEYLETSSPDVYAVGDAISVRNLVNGKYKMIPLASPANKQARLVADNVCEMARKYTGALGTAILKIFDLAVALTGESEKSLADSGTSYKKSITYSPSNAGYYPGGHMMTIKLLFSPSNGRLFGAQITGGKGVDKRIDVIATAIRAKMTVYDLQDLDLAYAPPFSSAKDPVNMAGYVAENIISAMTKPIYVEQLSNLQGNVMLVDVRTPGEFEKGSIPGSINLPLQQLRDRFSELDRSREIIVICRIGQRGYFAERILKQHGYSVRNLAGGYRLYKAQQNDR